MQFMDDMVLVPLQPNRMKRETGIGWMAFLVGGAEHPHRISLVAQGLSQHGDKGGGPADIRREDVRHEQYLHSLASHNPTSSSKCSITREAYERRS